MKKLLVFVMVLLMTAAASATVIDVVAVDIGRSGGRTGGINDPLQASDIIGLAIVLNKNAYPDYPDYDGYLLLGMDLGLQVSGAGTLGVDVTKSKTGAWVKNNLTFNSGFSVTGASYGGATGTADMIKENGIDSINGGSLGGIRGSAVLLTGLWVHCEGNGDVTVDLQIGANPTKYSPFVSATGGPYPQGWVDATNADLGDLIINQVPEPMTMALLGLGGLFLRRRK